jgi:alkaline phosphatase
LAFVERYGRWLRIRPAQLKNLHSLFARHGVSLVLLGICIPGLHGYVAYPAGLARMRFDVFLAMCVLGMGLWTLVFVGIGLLLTEHLDSITRTMHELGGVLIVVSLLVVGAGIWYSRHHARRDHRRTK